MREELKDAAAAASAGAVQAVIDVLSPRLL